MQLYVAWRLRSTGLDAGVTGRVRRGRQKLVAGLWVVRSPMERHIRDPMTDNEMTCESSSSGKLHCDTSDDWGSGTQAGCDGSIYVHRRAPATK